MDVASMADVMHYFGMKPVEFKKEWSLLSFDEKMQFKKGIGDGSFTY